MLVEVLSPVQTISSFPFKRHPLLKVVVQSSVYTSERLTQKDSLEIN